MSTQEDLDETVRLVNDIGRRGLGIKADVTDDEQMDAVVAQTLDELGRIDILLANAGIVSYAPTWEFTRAQWDQILRVDLTGV
jgi:NAD(P)-dependent dehydrogenase (short-subunit alcohol dehydrogenase family)